jgi:two-component system CheB/CheR fusion protein
VVLELTSTTFGEIHHRLVEHYAPPSLLVTAELEIVHSSEHAIRYLVSNESALLVAIHPALRLDAITTVYEARSARRRTASRIVRYRDDNRARAVGIHVRAVDLPGAIGMLLVLFEELAPDVDETADEATQVDRLRAQLAAAVQHYQTSLDELQASYQQLQIVNEELVASSAQLALHREQLQQLNATLETKLRQLARVNADLENLMVATDLGALFLDRELRIQLFTPRSRDAFDVTASDLGRPLDEITHRLEFPGACELAREVLRTREPVEQPVTARDGRMYLLRVLPYHTVDDVDGVVLTVIDVTELRRMEATLRDADRRKDEFLATLSHELRNPLTPLRVALDLQRAVTEPEQLEFTRQVMDRQLTQLTHLVDELLDISRITTGRIQLAPSTFPTREAIDAAIEATRPLFDAAEHRLAIAMIDPPDRLHADYARVTQILTNLLSNAAKYTPHGGNVDFVVERADGHVRFTIRDDGIGIAPGSLPCVFDLFAECRDDSGRSKPGLGVGLNLVKRLVELHGGTVEARSAGEGLGSEFVVELPIEVR